MQRPALLSVLLVVMFAFAGVGCARTHLFYDTRELRHRPLDAKTRPTLAQVVADRIQGKRVVWIDGAGKQSTVDATSVKKLPHPELGALWMATSTGEVGGEHDVRVHIEGKGSVPISVVVALDGSIVVMSPRERPSSKDRDDDDGAALTEEQIRDKFSLSGPLPGKWAEDERRALAQSLSALQPDELDVVRTITFDREAMSRDGDRDRSALYAMAGCRAKIFLYSSGVRSDKYRFVGDVKAPKSAVLHSLIHEIGHAIEQAPARRRFCAADKARGDRANELVREGNDLIHDSPVVNAYLAVLAGQPAPTDYGNSSKHESFAESFALFHVDPEALKRARPAVYAWFAKGGHVTALKSSSPRS